MQIGACYGHLAIGSIEGRPAIVRDRLDRQLQHVSLTVFISLHWAVTLEYTARERLDRVRVAVVINSMADT